MSELSIILYAEDSMALPSQHVMALPPRCKVVGIGIDAVGLTFASNSVIRLSEMERPAVVCLANVHMVMTALKNPELKSVMESAELVLPDGMPLVRQLRRKRPFQERVAGYDLIIDILNKHSRKDLRVSFFGSTPETLNKIRQYIEKKYPNVTLGTFYAPPFFDINQPLAPDDIQVIENTGPGIIFVGLGCPKQEIWMDKMRPYSKACMVGVGAAFHILSGDRTRAPVWMRDSSLEWVYRLFQEPKKLFSRYVATNTRYLIEIFRDHSK